MKTIFTLLASLLISVGVFAAKNNTILTVTSVDKSNIVMVLDGKRFEPKDNGIMVSGIEKGSHQIKVYRERNNGVLNLFGKKYEMVYNTSISMKNNTHMVITVERN